MKRLICTLLTAVFLLAEVFGGLNISYINNEALAADYMLQERNFVPSSNNVKLLGRTYSKEDSLWMAYSGTGAEFSFTGTSAEITILGDNIAATQNNHNNYCRIGIYVNGILQLDTLVMQSSQTFTVFQSQTEQTVVITVVKLSEASNSTVGIGNIKVKSKGDIRPTDAKPHRIEFIGDSITCGYGIEASRYDVFSTSTENVTKTYAYQSAQSLNADYSIVALSGFGVVSGSTPSITRNTVKILPDYYERLGYSAGKFGQNVSVASLYWNFSFFQPDVIVVNLGTNDYKYVRNYESRNLEFIIGYVDFLKRIRMKNPNARIVCVSGIMGDSMFSSIEKAVSLYTIKYKDDNVFSMQFDKPVSEDGYGVGGHPSEITHTKAAVKLTKFIKDLMNW